MKRRAIFLDRDGILNEDKGYVYRQEDITWLPGSKEMVADLTKRGYLLLVVTNQSGIARGMYTEEDVKALHRWMNEELTQMGGHIEDFFYCPHLVEGIVSQYAVDCVCRKPRPGMIIQALQKYRIQREDAVLFGDSERDVVAAKRAGIQGFLFEGGDIHKFVSTTLEKIGWQ